MADFEEQLTDDEKVCDRLAELNESFKGLLLYSFWCN